MAPESSTLKKGSRVVVITDIPGVAAGTTGRVGSIGVKTTRYRVKFDNGADVLSVAEGKLVSPLPGTSLSRAKLTAAQNYPRDSFLAVPVGTAAATSPTLEAPPVAQTPQGNSASTRPCEKARARAPAQRCAK